MTIWLLALVLLASLAGLGYRQGAIRVAFSFLGIVLGALLAAPLGGLVARLVALVGVKNPVLTWLLGPFIVFVVISIIFKVAAAAVHNKVDVYYKYHAGDLRLALWERLNRRLGLCLGLLNGTAYLVLIAFVIYILSYWTVQMATSDSDPRSLRILNLMGRDLQSSGFAKVARAVDRLPPTYYDTADIAGLLYQNSLLEARLSRYPAFLSLAERPEFQALGSDKDFLNLRQTQQPIMQLLQHPTVQAITENPDLLRTLRDTVVPDLSDLRAFLETGVSSKYGEKILGRWKFDMNLAVNLFRRAKPNTTPNEMKRVKAWMLAAFSKTGMVAMTDHKAVLKNVPQLRLPAAGTSAGGAQTMQGEWKGLDANKYQLTFSGADLPATVEGDRLMIKAEGMDLAFSRED
jgi:hypothetical protein